MNRDRKMINSGADWIGDIPSSWDSRYLNQVADVRLGKMLTPEPTTPNQKEVTYLRAANITGSSSELKSMWATQQEIRDNSVKNGDILVVEGGSIGYPKRCIGYKQETIIQNSVHRIRFYASQEFGYWVMWAAYGSGIYQDMVNSVSIAHLTKEKLTRLPVAMPPMKEQQAIANFLDHHVDLIDRERALIAKKIELLRQKRKALIFEVVTGKRTIVETHALPGDPDRFEDVITYGQWSAVPTPKSDDPFVKGGGLVDSGIEEIGEVPKEWIVCRLKSILTKNTGGVWGDEPTGDGDTIVLRSTEQTVNGEWDIKDPAYRKISPSEILKSKMSPGDILITKSSGSEAHIGKATIVTSEFGSGACYSNFMQRIRVQPNVSPRYVWRLLTSSLARNQFASLSNTTTGLANLNGSIIESIFIPLPHISIQLKIVEFLEAVVSLIDCEINLLQRKIELLADKRKALIFEAVTGKIDLRPNN